MRLHRRVWASVFLLVVFAMPQAGESQEIPAGYEVGVHIVREGDTLRGITRAYLGSESLWEKNWALNPQVEDPNSLYPLQRLRVLLALKSARPTARLRTISGDVDGKPAPADWNPAVEDDLMLERDGVRAGDDSSTVLEFNDGSTLTVVDDSMVFLRVAGRSLLGVEERSVEVVHGQADLEAAELPEETQIEVIIGGTVAKPRVAPGGGLETRARRSAEGGAELMVYEGASEVEAGGARVAVARGMGTAVPKSGPPAPPEKLLPAPSGLEPQADGEYELSRTRFSWAQVADAASYVVEICHDQACSRLAQRTTGITNSSWDVGEMPLGNYYWRVLAVSASGLDGYSSAPRAVQFVPLVVDTQPPTGSLTLVGDSVVQRGTTFHAPALEVRLEVADDHTGVEGVEITVNGDPVPQARLAQPWPSGPYEVTVEAVDGAGNRGTIGSVAFHVDADAPSVDLKAGGAELLGAAAERPAVVRRKKAGLARWARKRLARFDRGAAEPMWHVLRWSAVERPGFDNFVPNLLAQREQIRALRIPREELWLLLFAPALVPAGNAARLGNGFLLVEASDERSGMTEFEIRQANPEGSRALLEIDVVDRLGNRQVVPLELGARSERQ